MAFQLQCAKCGKVFVVDRTVTGKRILCTACGAVIANPKAAAADEQSGRQMSAAAGKGQEQSKTRHPLQDASVQQSILDTGADRNPRRSPIAIWLSSLCILIAVALMFLGYFATRGGRAANSDPMVQTIIALKNDAERLAIAGELAKAHKKYQEIEKLAAGRVIKDTALWDLTERAKFDQDRIYGLLVAAMENKIAAERAEILRRMPASAPSGIVVNDNPTPKPYPLPFGAALPSTRPVVRSDDAIGATTRSLSITTRPTTTSDVGGPSGIPVAPIAFRDDSVTDDQIGRAIHKGVEFLLGQFQNDQIVLEKSPNPTYLEGANALVVYALLQSSRAIREERLNVQGPLMKGLLERMKEHLMMADNATPLAPVTYARSLRAAALAVYNREEDRKQLREDAGWLIKNHNDGAYTYNDQIKRFGLQGLEGPADLKQMPAAQPFMMPGFDGEFIGGGKESGSTGAEFLRCAQDDARSSSNRPILYFVDPFSRSASQLHNGEKTFPVPPMTPLPQGWGRVPAIYPPISDRQYTEPAGLPWDNSNSQYGLLGVWSAAEVGVEVPSEYWSKVRSHWEACQRDSGEWDYNGKQQRGSFGMTVGGLASLFITHDYLEAPAVGGATGRAAFSRAMAAGLGWLEKGNNAIEIDNGVHYRGYNLFGLERVGLASGFKYFGKHDWFRELAAKVVAAQWANGAWGRADSGTDAIIDTAYTLLFLSKARYPVMMNKLRFDGAWNNRPRDLANLTTLAGRELERGLNWQIVSSDHDWSDWMDAPILFISSHTAPKFKEEDYRRLRGFAAAGGLIFTHADASSNAFNGFAGELARKLFPEREFATLPQDHEIYSIQYQIKTKPPLKYVGNGSRILMIHSPMDLSTAWQVRDLTKRQNWELGINLFVYASGKGDLRNRLDSPYVAELLGKTLHTVKLARLKYGGNWDPEPYAWQRFTRILKRDASWDLEVAPIDWFALKPETAALVHLTGTAGNTPTDVEIGALQAYVERGGIVLIDACGSSSAFSQSMRLALAHAFADRKLEAISGAHPLLSASFPGMTAIESMHVRPYTAQKLGASVPQLSELKAGKGHVIFSQLDITSGLLGSNGWGVMGYDANSAGAIINNLVIWAANLAAR